MEPTTHLRGASRPSLRSKAISKPGRLPTLGAATAGALLLVMACGLDRGAPRLPGAGPADPALASGPVLPHPTDLDLRASLVSGPRTDLPAAAGEGGERLEVELAAFYERRGGSPAWIASGSPSNAAGELIAALAGAGRHGLEPSDYRSERLAVRVAAARERELAPDELAALDADLSAAFLAFASDLCCGRLDRLPAAERWGRSNEPPELARSLERALAGGGLAAALDALAPPFPEYRGLGAALVRYRAIAAAGGWPEVPGGPPPRPGEPAGTGQMVALAERLRAEGYLGLEEGLRLYRGWTSERGVRYEEPLVGAVRSFQERHGLLPDAELGEATLAALGVPAEERAAQIAVNLERWRRVPRDLGERHVRVNVAGFRLSAFEGRREVLTMPVVVGGPGWETPLFADAIQYLELNPYWHVPASIARREILPKEVADPGYLARNAYQLVDRATGEIIDPATADLSVTAEGLRIRQRPGRVNAMGRIKFMFPNRFNVYLHDTPQRRAFERSGRALSHGCVRIERPVELAAFVLAGDPEWTAQRVRTAIDSGRSRRIDLTRPLPVYLLYWTAFEDTEGRLHFRPDVYGHDRRAAQRLAGVGARRTAVRLATVAGAGAPAGAAG